MLVPVQISDAARGVISRKALFWHGGTIFIGITAVLFGLLLSRKGPPAEVILDGLSSEEVLDRIAELDKRYERNEISKADYDRYRESLVTIAAEEISGETSAAREADGAAASAAPPPQPAFGPRTREMLREIHDLDETDLPSAEQIQQRAHLLEALYKSLKKDLES